jgi:hypothetical protein
VENQLGGDCRQTGKLTWRQGWQINLAATPLNWKITMALDMLFWAMLSKKASYLQTLLKV